MTTLVVLAGAVAALALSTWRIRQPRVLGVVQWIPYGGLQFVSLLVIVLMLTHLITLATGKPWTGRLMR